MNKYERDDNSSALRRYNRSLNNSQQDRFRHQSAGSRKKARLRQIPDIIKEETASDLEMLEFPLPKRLWQSNSVPACAVCDNKFWKFLGKSRHHCRICGKCVCGVCSIYRLRNYRICKRCKDSPENEARFPELAEGKSYPAEPLNSPVSVFADAVQLSDPEDAANSPVLAASVATPKGPHTFAGGTFSQSLKLDLRANGLINHDRPKMGSHNSYTRENSTPHGAMHNRPFSEGLPSPRVQIRRNLDFSESYSNRGENYREPSEVNSLSSFDRERRDSSVRCTANLSGWTTRHCIRWIRSLRLGDKEEKAVDAIRDLGLSGSDLQYISDRDLQVEMKIFSAILRKRILRNLEQLTQEMADAVVQEDDTGDIPPLNDKDIVMLAQQVQILRTCTFDAVDRIFILNSPSQFEVNWYPTNIRPGMHKITVVDRNSLSNSSSWIMRYDMGNTTEAPSLSTHCLGTNRMALRWRLHNGSVELCVNSVFDDLNTDLVVSLSTINVPKLSINARIPTISMKSASKVTTKPIPMLSKKRIPRSSSKPIPMVKSCSNLKVTTNPFDNTPSI